MRHKALHKRYFIAEALLRCRDVKYDNKYTSAYLYRDNFMATDQTRRTNVQYNSAQYPGIDQKER